MKRVLFLLSPALLLAASGLRFEVASIRPHDPNLRVSTMQSTHGGELSIFGMTIRNLIWLAWKLPPERVMGGPKWLDTELYDIRAKTSIGAASSMDQQMSRLQTLFAERLHLRVHREAREAPVYFLHIVRTGIRMAPDSSRSGKGSILPWSMVVSSLSRITGRPVVDQTGLSGAWYIQLRYTTDDGVPSGLGIADASNRGGPSIFTAVQEQLGLRLDSGKAPVDRLVIDAVERPSAN